VNVFRIKLLILLFVASLAGSFGVAGYLLVKSSRQPTGQAAAAGDVELLASGERFLRSRQTEQALVVYRRVLTSNPRSLAAQLGLAHGELLAGRDDMAAQEFDRVLQLDPGNTTALRQLARIYSHRARTWPLAEARFREYLTLRPDDRDAQLQSGRVFFWQGKWRAAADVYSRPTLARLLDIQDKRDYVVALARSGQGREAEIVLKRFLAEGPQDYELKLQLASVYAARREWDTALPLYKALLQERPNEPSVNLTYGVGLLSSGDYRGALEPLGRARNAMPSSGEAGLAYGRALRGVKEYKSAAREYERVRPTYRTDPAFLREFADLLLEKQDYRKAEGAYRDAYDLGLRDVRLLVSYAGALRGNGKPRAALPYLEEAYRREPTDRLAFELARLMHEVGRTREASQLLSRIETSSTQAAR
jgi:predicted Zn-dependent protease